MFLNAINLIRYGWPPQTIGDGRITEKRLFLEPSVLGFYVVIVCYNLIWLVRVTPFFVYRQIVLVQVDAAPMVF